ncbi:hypothetical protein BN903_174 [Halorubrum sp. AJ67]|nr:hypothetical protein BN903_174 [Halorubrum sp. AJ67]
MISSRAKSGHNGTREAAAVRVRGRRLDARGDPPAGRAGIAVAGAVLRGVAHRPARRRRADCAVQRDAALAASAAPGDRGRARRVRLHRRAPDPRDPPEGLV